jgi:hypothetical protein
MSNPKDFYTKGGYFVRRVPEPRPGDLRARERDVPATPLPDYLEQTGRDIRPEEERQTPEQATPREWDGIVDALKNGEPWRAIRPEWLDPPKTGKIVDIYTNDPVVLAPASVDVEVVRYAIPDRYVGMFLDFGHALTDPSLFGTVLWTIAVNEAPEEFYNGWKPQLGEFVRPTAFPRTVPAKYNDVIRVTASNPGLVAVSAFARIRGWIFPVEDENLERYMTI